MRVRSSELIVVEVVVGVAEEQDRLRIDLVRVEKLRADRQRLGLRVRRDEQRDVALDELALHREAQEAPHVELPCHAQIGEIGFEDLLAFLRVEAARPCAARAAEMLVDVPLDVRP